VNIKTDWESYKGGAYLADVARSICASNPTKGGTPKLAKADNDAPTKAAAPVAEPAPASGRITVQFISSPSERDVNAAVAKVRDRLAGDIGGRTLAVESATVRGTTRYRGRLSGFSSAVEAEAFCSKIVELNLPCISIGTVRR
jgi:SPOR domain